MAKDYKPEDIMFPEQKIVSSEIVSEMKSSFIDYAMSVKYPHLKAFPCTAI